MKYYLHDSNSFNDERITELYINFGFEGLGLFYTMLEKFAQQEKPIKTQVLKKQLNIGKRLEKCWKFIEEIGLIQSSNGETFNERILNFAGKYRIKNQKNAERVSQWRENQSIGNNVTHYENVRNEDKLKESKVKESKGKESKVKEQRVLSFISPEWAELWAGWCEYKETEFRDKYKSDKSEQVAISNLVEMSGEDLTKARQIVQQSIANRWKGLFNLQNTKNDTTKSNIDLYAQRRAEMHEIAAIIDKQRGIRP